MLRQAPRAAQPRHGWISVPEGWAVVWTSTGKQAKFPLTSRLGLLFTFSPFLLRRRLFQTSWEVRLCCWTSVVEYLPTGSAKKRPTLAPSISFSCSHVRALFGFPKVDAILVQTAVAQGLRAARGTTVSGVAFGVCFTDDNGSIVDKVDDDRYVRLILFL